MPDQAKIERELELSPDYDLERWREGSNPRGDPRGDLKPYWVPYGWPYNDRSHPDAKLPEEQPDFSSLGPKRK